MKTFDPDLIPMLRKMAVENRSVAEMVHAIHEDLSSKSGRAIEVLRYFRGAFYLTLSQANLVADWIVYERNGSSDSQLHELVSPFIESQRTSWERQMPG